MKDLDRRLIVDFLYEQFEEFQVFLEIKEIEPTEAEVIIEDLNKNRN